MKVRGLWTILALALLALGAASLLAVTAMPGRTAAHHDQLLYGGSISLAIAVLLFVLAHFSARNFGRSGDGKTSLVDAQGRGLMPIFEEPATAVSRAPVKAVETTPKSADVSVAAPKVVAEAVKTPDESALQEPQEVAEEAPPVDINIATKAWKKALANLRKRPDGNLRKKTRGNTPDLLFYTCADAKYEDYAPLYIASTLWSVARSVAEVGLVSVDSFSKTHAKALEVLKLHLGDRFMLRDVVWHRKGVRILPNTIRFLNEPLTKADFVYIGDIDIVHLDREFPEEHLRFMKTTNVPYANMLRAGTARMTGLHFTLWDALYPVPDVTDLPVSQNDEIVLGIICDRKGLPHHSAKFRPVPGIHISPNRPAVGSLDANGRRQTDWSMKGWIATYKVFRASELMTDLYPTLQGKAKDAIDTIDAAIVEHFPNK